MLYLYNSVAICIENILLLYRWNLQERRVSCPSEHEPLDRDEWSDIVGMRNVDKAGQGNFASRREAAGSRDFGMT